MGAKVQIYLAGPTVFLRNAVELGQQKKDILARYGMEGHFPFDNELDFNALPSPGAAGFEIGRLNYRMMDKCDTVIADLTPFRGPSADVGTVMECGYMLGKGKIVNGYSHVEMSFYNRTVQHYNNDVVYEKEATIANKDNTSIEPFGLFDNLMIPSAIKESNGLFRARNVDPSVMYSDLSLFAELAQEMQSVQQSGKVNYYFQAPT